MILKMFTDVDLCINTSIRKWIICRLNIIFPSIAHLAYTLSDRKIYPYGYMFPSLWTLGLGWGVRLGFRAGSFNFLKLGAISWYKLMRRATSFVLLRLKLLGQRKLPIVFLYQGCYAFDRWARSALLIAHSMTALLDRRLHNSLSYGGFWWDEASVSKIVCSCTSWLRTPTLHHGVPRISTIFVLLRLKLLRLRKLPIVFPLSGILCLWPLSSQCASPNALNVSAARQALTPG